MKPHQKLQKDTIDKALDKACWQSFIAGDKDSFSKIYNAFIGEMFAYGMAIVPDKDFIKDCIQDVYIDLWKYRTNLSKTDNIKLYLFKSLRTKIYKLVAKENKNNNLESAELTLIPSHEDTLINDQRTKLLQSKLAKGIDDLPKRQREVIRLIFFEKRSYEETSNLMDINVRSVYTLAWKALSSLRKGIVNVYILLIIISPFA